MWAELSSSPKQSKAGKALGQAAFLTTVLGSNSDSLHGYPQFILPSTSVSEKPGAEQGVGSRFLTASASLNPENGSAAFEAKPGRSCLEQDLGPTGTQGSPHPAQTLQGARSKPFCTRAKQLLSFLLCMEQPLPPQTDQPVSPPQLCSWSLTNQAKIKKHKWKQS